MRAKDNGAVLIHVDPKFSRTSARCDYHVPLRSGTTETSVEELRDGYKMLKEVSDRTGIPVAYTTGKKDLLEQFLAEGHDPKYIGKPIPIDVYMHRDWDSYIKYGLHTVDPQKNFKH